LHSKDLRLLKRIQSFFGVGTIRVRKQNNQVIYSVKSIKDLTNCIIPHFLKYPLLTQKRGDFELLKMVVELMNAKEHLTTEGLRRILAIRASMNKGLTAVLAEAFPNITSVERPTFELPESIDPNWLVGFVDAESCFLVSIFKSNAKIGLTARMVFKVTQHTRDAQLMERLVAYLGCGKYYAPSRNKPGDYIVTKFSDINNKIIPFFQKYPLSGSKAAEFADFKEIARIIREKGHTIESGLEEIRLIKSRMKKGRAVGDSKR
jgi:hypothetical protein